MVQNNQESRLKYWATCSSIRLLTQLLARSLRSLPRWWESQLLDGYFVCVFFFIFDHSATPTRNERGDEGSVGNAAQTLATRMAASHFGGSGICGDDGDGPRSDDGRSGGGESAAKWVETVG